MRIREDLLRFPHFREEQTEDGAVEESLVRGPARTEWESCEEHPLCGPLYPWEFSLPGILSATHRTHVHARTHTDTQRHTLTHRYTDPDRHTETHMHPHTHRYTQTQSHSRIHTYRDPPTHTDTQT